MRAVADAIDVARTLFIVSSKSGGTIEPNALLAYFRDLQPDPAHFVAITDPGTSMHELAEREGFRHIFLSDPEIGGRYSALSPFGIVPAALAGRRRAGGARGRAGGAGELRAGRGQLRPVARRRARRARAAGPRQAHVRRRPAAGLVRPLGRAARGRVDRQAGPRHPADRRRAARRPRPRTATTACSCTCATPTRPTRATRRRSRALAAAGHPTITVTAAGVNDLGRVFFFSEFATAVAGWALGINPFDQPNVQEAKDNTAQGARSTARPRTSTTARSASCSTAWPRRRTSRSWATCPTTTRSTPPWPGCAGR